MKNKIFFFGCLFGIGISYVVDTVLDFVIKVILIFN